MYFKLLIFFVSLNKLNLYLAQSLSQLALTGYEFELADILDIRIQSNRVKRINTKRDSATKFLLKLYNDINSDEINNTPSIRQKRDAENIDTDSSQSLNMYEYNTVITFSSKEGYSYLATQPNTINKNKSLFLNFNTKHISKDLELIYSKLRIFKNPASRMYNNNTEGHITISIYKRISSKEYSPGYPCKYQIVDSINTTNLFKGWLEFNTTQLLKSWMNFRRNIDDENKIEIRVTISPNEPIKDHKLSVDILEINASEVGIIGVTDNNSAHLKPFIIGYFQGPELMAKIQKLRFKREVIKRQRKADFVIPRSFSSFQHNSQWPKSCERLNFTLDFKEMQMHNWVIAPKKFEAYFCGGECNFPLGSKMNATNHAIVQTLMHLKQPNIPKPCCVPTVLGSISILHYLNEDSVNLSKYPQSVAKECGCH